MPKYCKDECNVLPNAVASGQWRGEPGLREPRQAPGVLAAALLAVGAAERRALAAEGHGGAAQLLRNDETRHRTRIQVGGPRLREFTY